MFWETPRPWFGFKMWIRSSNDARTGTPFSLFPTEPVPVVSVPYSCRNSFPVTGVSILQKKENGLHELPNAILVQWVFTYLG